MPDISLADAKARLSELVERAAAGEAIEITRRGKRIARLVGIGFKAPVKLEALRELAGQSVECGSGAGAFMRDVRDTDRY